MTLTKRNKTEPCFPVKGEWRGVRTLGPNHVMGRNLNSDPTTLKLRFLPSRPANGKPCGRRAVTGYPSRKPRGSLLHSECNWSFAWSSGAAGQPAFWRDQEFKDSSKHTRMATVHFPERCWSLVCPPGEVHGTASQRLEVRPPAAPQHPKPRPRPLLASFSDSLPHKLPVALWMAS